MIKRSSKFTQKIIHVDDMMIHNFAKYLVQTRLSLWDIKEICYFYISQTKLSLYKIFYKVVYHHIIYMCDFFCEFRWPFCHGLYRFSRRFSFHQICSHQRYTLKTKSCLKCWISMIGDLAKADIIFRFIGWVPLFVNINATKRVF